MLFIQTKLQIREDSLSLNGFRLEIPWPLLHISIDRRIQSIKFVVYTFSVFWAPQPTSPPPSSSHKWQKIFSIAVTGYFTQTSEIQVERAKEKKTILKRIKTIDHSNEESTIIRLSNIGKPYLWLSKIVLCVDFCLLLLWMFERTLIGFRFFFVVFGRGKWHEFNVSEEVIRRSMTRMGSEKKKINGEILTWTTTNIHYIVFITFSMSRVWAGSIHSHWQFFFSQTILCYAITWNVQLFIVHHNNNHLTLTI